MKTIMGQHVLTNDNVVILFVRSFHVPVAGEAHTPESVEIPLTSDKQYVCRLARFDQKKQARVYEEHNFYGNELHNVKEVETK